MHQGAISNILLCRDRFNPEEVLYLNYIYIYYKGIRIVKNIRIMWGI